jgi:ubiquinone/menaquinone biosynthesis methyltransferase
MKRLLDYRPDYVAALFDRMAATYGAVNLASSFGFSHFWRQACLDELAPPPAARCADLMCGMGEMTTLLKGVERVTVDAIDFSAAMCAKARAASTRHSWTGVEVRQADVLTLAREPRYDRIAVTFGLKTLDDARLEEFARVLWALLHRGGRVALVEIHLPPSRLLRWPYLFYLRQVIPLIGRIFLGDPDCYRSLAVYTEDFSRRDRMVEHLRAAGFSARQRGLFFGCARLYVADKPAPSFS